MHTAKNLKGLWPECLFIYARLYSQLRVEVVSEAFYATLFR